MGNIDIRTIHFSENVDVSSLVFKDPETLSKRQQINLDLLNDWLTITDCGGGVYEFYHNAFRSSEIKDIGRVYYDSGTKFNIIFNHVKYIICYRRNYDYGNIDSKSCITAVMKLLRKDFIQLMVESSTPKIVEL